MRSHKAKIKREKCFVCKLVPDCNHWKFFEKDGVEVPVCQKLCAVQGGFIPKPERKDVARQYAVRAPGYQKISKEENWMGAIYV